jgi:chromosome segregation protein
VRVGRRERIDQLNEAIAKLESAIGIAEGSLREVRQELGTIDLRRLGDEVRKIALIRNDRQQRIDALRGRVEDILSQQQSLHDELQRIAEEVQSHSTDLAAVEQEIAEASSIVSARDKEIAEAEQHLRSVEAQSAERLAELRAVEIRLVRLQGEQQTLTTDEQRLANQSLTIDQRRAQRSQERIDLVQQLEQLEQQRVTDEAQAARIVARLTEARANRENLELQVKGHAAAVQEGSEQLRRDRKALDTLLAEQYDADVKLNEVTLRLESLVRRATEELDITPDETPSNPESEIGPEQLRIDVQELRRRLTSMGNVNFLALEEHERENERLNFLNQQLADLTESERTLNETIAEINQTAREKFTATFTAIRENFTVLFKMLFSEDDEADLQMVESEDGDPLECTIDITAKPRGKRPHSIEMLSGGEKTLTAIALLFAIYLVKPSPFCILDEVDAPLDDANIDRYLKIIRKFAENTQFLMITHNKKTMEAADTLYGVTMEEPAVSKVVSVQLSGAAA